jgi:hypothetical protein
VSAVTIPEWLRVGAYLHTSCNGVWWGPIKKIHQDANGRLVVDFEFSSDDMGEFLDTYVDMTEPGAEPNLAMVEMPSVRCLMRDVPLTKISDSGERLITLETPGDGCFRCSKLFSVHDTMGGLRRDRPSEWAPK